MPYQDQSYRWRNPWFVLRVLLSCLLVPATVPIVLALQTKDLIDNDWLEMLMFLPIAAIVGSPAMIFLGIPLLCIYLRWGLTGFVPFLIGGGICATAVFDAILRSPIRPEMLEIYTLCGVVGGALFRVILFGFDPTFIGKRRDAASARPGSLAIGKPGAVIAALVLSASGLMLYYMADHHVSMTKRMYCECEIVKDKADPFRPHLEELRLVYHDNPRFEERLAGPSLCADLRRAGQQTADVTFDVWHNWKNGRGGYIIKKIMIGGKRREIFGTMIGGFHPDSRTYVEYTDSAPDPARFADFPLNQD
jgi:hypothetical protein